MLIVPCNSLVYLGYCDFLHAAAQAERGDYHSVFEWVNGLHSYGRLQLGTLSLCLYSFIKSGCLLKYIAFSAVHAACEI